VINAVHITGIGWSDGWRRRALRSLALRARMKSQPEHDDDEYLSQTKLFVHVSPERN